LPHNFLEDREEIKMKPIVILKASPEEVKIRPEELRRIINEAYEQGKNDGLHEYDRRFLSEIQKLRESL
jgi:hypothetical protein